MSDQTNRSQPPAQPAAAAARRQDQDKDKRSVEERLDELEGHVASIRGVPRGPKPRELLLSEVVTIPIVAATGEGKKIDMPASNTFSVTTSDDTVLRAGIGTAKSGGPALVLRPLRESESVSVSLTDSHGLQSAGMWFSIVKERSDGKKASQPNQLPPNEPAKLILDLDNAAAEPQTN